MTRETAAARKARIARLLADYNAVNGELRKLEREVKALKEQVREVEPGTYGEWQLGLGTAREITDMDAVREDYAARKVELPTKFTEPPRVVTHLATTQKGKHRR